MDYSVAQCTHQLLRASTAPRKQVENALQVVIRMNYKGLTLSV